MLFAEDQRGWFTPFYTAKMVYLFFSFETLAKLGHAD